MIISDLHVPDHDIRIFDLYLKFIAHYQPDYLDILGDFINFTKISKYDQDAYYKTDIADEIQEGRGLLKQLVDTAHKANKDVHITYFQGNHEKRLQKYLGRNAQQLADLTLDGEYIVSIPHLFELKKLNVKWVPDDQIVERHNTIFIHGASTAKHAANINIQKFGTSGFSAHTHRLKQVEVTWYKNRVFWVEVGCSCNRQPQPSYTIMPDWQQGFSVAEYNFDTHQFYPQIIPIINHSFEYGGKIFK